MGRFSINEGKALLAKDKVSKVLLKGHYTVQPRCEQLRRLDLIVDMSIELARVKRSAPTILPFVADAIEAVLDGNWATVFWYATEAPKKIAIPMLLRIYEPLRVLLQKAYDGRPETTS